MVELKTLSGKIIPPIGVGTFPLQGEEMFMIMKHAFDLGYRLIDTADDYRGETGIGLWCERSHKSGIIKREDIFIQTKISDDNAHANEPLAGIFFNRFSDFMRRHSVEEIVRDKVEESLRKMRTDYVDSLLIHLPYPNYYEEIWYAMGKLKKEGKIRYIGVSNFHHNHVEQISKSGASPSINEIYVSPICTKEILIKYSQSKEMIIMSYSPLMDLASNRIKEDLFSDLMLKYHKSIAQIIIRWNIDRGCIPLPKTKNLNRLKENFDVFNFELTKEEISLISSLNCNYQYLPESKICPGL